jgi:hypothetical protein
MKIREQKAKKITALFKIKLPLLTVTQIYDTEDGIIVRAVEDTEAYHVGTPFYQLLDDNKIVNISPFGNPEFFQEIVQEDNKIYQNSDVDEPNRPKD